MSANEHFKVRYPGKTQEHRRTHRRTNPKRTKRKISTKPRQTGLNIKTENPCSMEVNSISLEHRPSDFNSKNYNHGEINV